MPKAQQKTQLEQYPDIDYCPKDIALFFECLTYGFAAIGPMRQYFNVHNVQMTGWPIEALECPSDTKLTPAWKYLILNSMMMQGEG